MVRRALWFLAWLAAVAGAGQTRAEELFYLDQFNEPPFQLKCLHRAAITVGRDGRGVIGYLAKRQPVTVLAVGQPVHYVSAQLATGRVRGWVEAAALEPPPAELVARLRQRHARRLRHLELIARGEVAAGMTQAEVRASLGRPQRRVRVRTADGRQEQWVYVTYRYVPYYRRVQQPGGGWRQLVSYRRQPWGQRVIVFVGGEVSAVEESMLPVPAARD
jgi:hypothetical protein